LLFLVIVYLNVDLVALRYLGKPHKS